MKKFIIWLIEGFLFSILAIFSMFSISSLLSLIVRGYESISNFREHMFLNISISLISLGIVIISVIGLSKIESKKTSNLEKKV
jgi:hypothetical protein